MIIKEETEAKSNSLSEIRAIFKSTKTIGATNLWKQNNWVSKVILCHPAIVFIQDQTKEALVLFYPFLVLFLSAPPIHIFHYGDEKNEAFIVSYRQSMTWVLQLYNINHKRKKKYSENWFFLQMNWACYTKLYYEHSSFVLQQPEAFKMIS